MNEALTRIPWVTFYDVLERHPFRVMPAAVFCHVCKMLCNRTVIVYIDVAVIKRFETYLLIVVKCDC